MVRHEVENDADPGFVQRAHQSVEVCKRAKERIDVDIIGDIIAEVGHRRGVDRRDPDGVDAEPTQVVGAIENAPQVADAIAIAVLKRARVNLIDDCLLPPRSLAHRLLQLRNARSSAYFPSAPISSKTRGAGIGKPCSRRMTPAAALSMATSARWPSCS